MPRPLITSAIVVFWLGMAGLFVYEVLWPRLMPSEPAMFPVDIVDEAGPQLETTSWLVYKNGGGGYRAATDWEYVAESDTFRSRCQLSHAQRVEEAPRELGGPWLPQFHEVKTDSHYHMTRAGQMTGIEATTTYTLALPALAEDGLTVTAKVSGHPRTGRFVPQVELSFPIPGGELGRARLRPKDVAREAAPVAVSPRGLVLNPLHPPRRLADLRPGQRWQVTLLDPFALLDLVGCLGSAAGDRLRHAGVADDAVADVLEARALPDLETLHWEEKNEDVTCRLIRCAGDDPYPALTLWVRERDGMLYKQEATTRSGDVWTFVRRPFNYRMQQAPFQPVVFLTDPPRVASVIGQLCAAQAAAPAAPPAGRVAQDVAALAVTQTPTWDLPGHRQ